MIDTPICNYTVWNVSETASQSAYKAEGSCGTLSYTLDISTDKNTTYILILMADFSVRFFQNEKPDNSTIITWYYDAYHFFELSNRVQICVRNTAQGPASVEEEMSRRGLTGCTRDRRDRSQYLSHKQWCFKLWKTLLCKTYITLKIYITEFSTHCQFLG